MLGALDKLHSLEPKMLHGNLTVDAVQVSQDKPNHHSVDFKMKDLSKCHPVSQPQKSYCRFAAPEVTREEKSVTTAADIWSLGILVYYLIGDGKFPYQDWTEFTSSVKLSEQLSDIGTILTEGPQANFFGSEARDFLEKCLCAKPSDRWSAKELVGHPWIDNQINKRAKHLADLQHVRVSFVKRACQNYKSIKHATKYEMALYRALVAYECLDEDIPAYDDMF